jgi:hypothetical protein
MNNFELDLFGEEQLVDSRKIGDRVMTVIQLPPEDPESVKERDYIRPEHVGSRPMVDVVTHSTDPFSDWTTGRKAPKYL